MKKRAFGKLYKELFYIPKHEKLTEKVFRSRMAVSLLTMLACTAVLITSTLAWFNMSITTQVPAITSAYYSVTVDNAENGVYICPLVSNDKHIFVITANGTASTGYCKIQIDEKVYYTEQVLKGSSLTLSIQAAQGTAITFTSEWGSADRLPCENEIIHSVTPSAEYTVEATATLEGISQYYDVSVSDILTYNGITELTVGNVIKIPGVSPETPSYVAPAPEPSVVDDTVSDGDGSTGEQQTTQETTEPTNEDTTVSDGDTTPTDQPTVETPAEGTTPTEETPAAEQPIEETPAPVETPSTEETPVPEEITSDGEDNGGEEPAPAGDEVPTDTGATE